MRVIFISDLDGTLLSQTNFRFDEIKEEIVGFLAKSITLIPASSKTQIEIENFCQSLGAELPFICENGAVFLNSHLLRRKIVQNLDPSVRHVLGRSRSDLIQAWDTLIPQNLRELCIFLDNMKNAHRQATLGLSGAALCRAMNRSHSVLFTFQGTASEFIELQRVAARARLMIQCGGRACTLSALHDKASYHRVIRQIAVDEGSSSILVGFGDAQNDVSMLQNCDVACIIPRPDCQPLILPKPPKMLLRAETVAPLGWLETARQALSLIEQKYGEQNG